jgi:hypothetical protein
LEDRLEEYHEYLNDEIIDGALERKPEQINKQDKIYLRKMKLKLLNLLLAPTPSCREAQRILNKARSDLLIIAKL